MSIDRHKQNTMKSRAIDFAILGCTFFVSSMLLSAPLNGNTLVHTLLYATVILVSVRLGWYFLSAVSLSVNSVVKLMLCNATGLLGGGIIMLVLGNMVIPGFNELVKVVVFASVMAFFILGTVSPLLKKSANTPKNGHMAS